MQWLKESAQSFGSRNGMITTLANNDESSNYKHYALKHFGRAKSTLKSTCNQLGVPTSTLIFNAGERHIIINHTKNSIIETKKKCLARLSLEDIKYNIFVIRYDDNKSTKQHTV